MKSIRIQNLRSLNDTGTIELKPITVLVGENSSGKSTFLRAFPLIRQSVEVKNRGPLLWYGKYVDFGSFSEAVNAFSENKEIYFKYDFGKIRTVDRQNRLWDEDIKNINLELRIRIIADQKRDAVIDRLELYLEDNLIETEFNSEGIVSHFTVNNRDYTDTFSDIRVLQIGGLLPHIVSKDSTDSHLSGYRFYRFVGEKMVIEALREYVHPKTEDKTLLAIFQKLCIGSKSEMLMAIKNISRSLSGSWVEKVKDWDETNEDFLKIRDILIASNVSRLLQICDEELSSFARNIRYIAPLRATAERYYRIQNLAVDEVDFQGQNLPMFLRNLTDTERKKFSEWTESLFGFSPQPSPSGGHTSIYVSQGEGIKFNLTDMGFGFSQILPILTQLWQLSQKKFIRTIRPWDNLSVYFAIEQPELHLHPRMQSKLAIAFSSVIEQAKAEGIDLKLIIETHSDTLLNTFGRLIATGNLDPEDINVVLFEKPNANQPTTVQISKFDEKGFLTNWPYGFFEPAWE